MHMEACEWKRVKGTRINLFSLLPGSYNCELTGTDMGQGYTLPLNLIIEAASYDDPLVTVEAQEESWYILAKPQSLRRAQECLGGCSVLLNSHSLPVREKIIYSFLFGGLSSQN